MFLDNLPSSQLLIVAIILLAIIIFSVTQNASLLAAIQRGDLGGATDSLRGLSGMGLAMSVLMVLGLGYVSWVYVKKSGGLSAVWSKARSEVDTLTASQPSAPPAPTISLNPANDVGFTESSAS